MKKAIKITLWIAIASLVVGIGMIITFNLIPATVDANGMVQEPFALMAIGGLLVLISLFMASINIVLRFLAKGKAKNQN